MLTVNQAKLSPWNWLSPVRKEFPLTYRHLRHSLALIVLTTLAGFGLGAAELVDGWESVEPGGGALRVSISFTPDGQHGWTSGIRNLSHTANGGKTWTNQWSKGGADAYWFNNVVAISAEVAVVTGFAYGDNRPGIVLRTADGGATWQPIKVGSGRADAGFGSLAFTPDRTVGFLISNREGLFRTRDRGLTWEPVSLGAACEASWVATRGNIAVVDDRTVFVGCSGALARSTDAGATWSLLPFPAAKGKMFHAVRFASAQRGWVFFHGDPKAWETTDGGATWTPSAIPGLPAFADARQGWAISGFGVVHTTDGGATWGEPVRVGGAQTQPANVLCTKTHLWVVGGQEGTGTAFLARRLLPGVKDDAPPAGVIPIIFKMPAPGFATIQVVNDAGDVVENVVAGRQFPAGRNTVWWDLATLDDFWPPFTRSNQWQYESPPGVAKIAAPGKYRWRGLWHPGLSLEYQYSFYPLKDHGLAWITPDGTGGWLGDHSPPQDVVRTGNTMWVGSFCEGGDALLEADLDMKKLWGTNRIELACPHVLATDGSAVYFIEQGGWLGFANQAMAMIRVDTKSHAAKRVFAVPKDDAPGDLKSAEGLAVIGARAWIADREQNAVVVCDLAPNLAGTDGKLHVLRRIAVAQPGRIRPYPDGRLACVTKDGVVLIDPRTFAVTPVVTGCTNPLGLAVDDRGSFYVGEMAPAHQVKVFDQAGQLQRTIGKPGPHQVGPFNRDNLEAPSGIEVDACGNVWVCEFSNDVRRTSVWGPDGHCLRQVLGSAEYGGGAAGIDPADANRLFARGLELRRDPKTGAITPVNLIWRYDDPRYDRFVDTRPHNFGGPVPSYPFRRHGKLFFSLWGGYGLGELTALWVYEQNQVRPVAACGSLPGWLRERLGAAAKGMGIFAWTDANGDGRVQPAEVQLGALAPGGAVWGVRMNDNFDVAFSSVSGDVGMAFFHAGKLTPEGYPVYTLPAAYVPVPNLAVHDPNQVQACYADRKGNGIGVAPFVFSLSPQGAVNWRYKLRWPGLHGGLSTTATGGEPGVLVAGIRAYGSAVVNARLGEVLCLGSNYGATDLLTCDDGLYIGRVFLDARRGDAWSYNAPPTPAALSQVSLGQEHFGGSFQRTVDERGQAHFRYVVSPGGPSCSVIELKGLENVRRLPGGRLRVTPEHLVAADRLRQRRAVEAKEEKTYVIRRLANIKVDGRAADWPESVARIAGFALAYDAANLYVLFDGGDDRAVFRNAATQADWMEAFIHGDVVDVMLQTKSGLDARRDHAGEGDIRLSFTLVDGKPAAILYDYVVPGTPAEARRGFSSPARSEYVDQVRLLGDAKIAVTRRADGYTLEAAVPLAALHLAPAPGLAVAGDVGRVLSDQSGTTRLDRVYWSNPNTRTVKDVPSEVRLQPDLWGQFTFGE